MSKKVISVLLSVAILATMLCVGVGMLTASADTVTYYFLAPDSYLQTNDTVGVYYWQPKEPAPWPGVEMKKAESVGKNVFSTTVGDNDETEFIIFNAFVDAGSPADPALAAVAHQTVNVELNGNDKYENFYGMIYVLANDDAHKSVDELSGAVKGSGEWFSIDPSAPDYYKNSKEFYGSYGFKEENPDDANKEVHKDDTVKVSLTLGGVANAGTLTDYIKFDSSTLKYTSERTINQTEGATVLVNDSFSEEDGLKDTVAVGAVFNPLGTEMAYAGDPTAVVTFNFTALKDMTLADAKAAVSQIAEEITKIDPEKSDVVDVYTNYDLKNEGNAFTGLAFDVVCPHKEDPSSSEASSSATSSAASSSATSSAASSSATSSAASSSATSSSATSSAASSSATSSAASSTTSSKSSSTGSSTTSSSTSSTKSSTSSSSNTSNKNTSNSTKSTASNGAAVPTAGTFAVVSLIVVLMAAASVVLYTRKKTEE